MRNRFQSGNNVPNVKFEPLQLTPGIGEGRNLPSPSGINQMSNAVQASVVIGIMAGLGISTVIASAALDLFGSSFPGIFLTWKLTWPLLGPLFILAGVSHFTIHDDFCNIYPPRGTWGFWYIPGSPSFHVYWTGIVEFLGGLMVSVGGLAQVTGIEYQPISLFLADGSLLLCALVYVVSFANIYMYTHGATLPTAMKDAGEVPLTGHLLRGFLQVLILALLWQMGRDEPLLSALLAK